MGENLTFRITVKDDGSASVEKFGGTLRRTGKLSQRVGATISRAFGGIRRGIVGLPRLVFNLRTAIVGLAGAVIVKKLTKQFGDFEAQMNRISVITGERRGAVGGQFANLNALALQLGETTAFSAKQAAEGMEFLALAGFKAEEVLQALPATLTLAAAAQLELGQAADIVTNILTGLRLPVSELGRANDVLVKTFQSTNTNLQQLGEAFKFVGPVAASSGLQFEEVAATLGLLGNAGIQGTMAGTTLRGALARLLNPSKEASKILRLLGVNAFNSAGQMRPFADILEDLEKSGAGNAEIFAIFGQRAGPGISALVGQGADALRKLTKELKDSGGAAQDAADIQLAGLNGSLIKMRSAVEGAAISLGEKLAPFISKAAEVIKFFAGEIGAAVKAISAMAGESEGGATAAEKFADALRSITPSAETLIKVFFGIQRVIQQVTTLFVFLGLKAQQTFLAINTALATIIPAFDKTSETITGFFEPLRKIIFDVVLSILEGFESLIETFENAAGALSGVSKSARAFSLQLTDARLATRTFRLELVLGNEIGEKSAAVIKKQNAAQAFLTANVKTLTASINASNKALDKRFDALAALDAAEKKALANLVVVREERKRATAATAAATEALKQQAAAAKVLREKAVPEISKFSLRMQEVARTVNQELIGLDFKGLADKFKAAVGEIDGAGPVAQVAVEKIGKQFSAVAALARKLPEGLRTDFEMMLLASNATTEQLVKTAEKADAKVRASAKARRDAILSGAQNLFGTLASITKSGGAKLFKIQQAFAAGEAVVQGIKAVTVAFASAPPPLNFALAAAVAVQAALNVRRILQAKPGGGAGINAPSGGGGGGPGAPGGIPSAPEQAALEAPPSQVSISVAGFIGDEAQLASEIGRVLREAEGDGVQVNVST